MHVYADENIDF